MSQPLFINDYGFICSLGRGSAKDCESVVEKLQNGIHAEFVLQNVAGVMKPVASIDAESLPPVAIAGFDNRVNRLSQIALDEIDGTIRKAVEKFGPERIGIFLGSCDNGSEASLAALKCFKEKGRFPEGYLLDFQKADFPARYIAKRYGITGMISVHSTACASSASALVSARNNIYAGNCDAAIVGGVDIASLTVILGFSSLEAMSEKPTNPFSANRSGLTLGDGAVFFLVTKDDCAELSVEGAKGLKVLGFGESADADHITAPRADGAGAFDAMSKALADAEISASQVDYVNLHGTGTVLNDSMECLAVHKLFGGNVPASSTKALTGHTLGAAGALEAAFCCMALKKDFLPAHHFDGVQDPLLPKMNLVTSQNSSKKSKYCISNSFAFGGCNVSLVVGCDC